MRANVAVVVALASVAAAERLRHAPSRPQHRVRRDRRQPVVTIESTDRRLEAAILAESIRPTAESQLQVAREYVRLGILDVAFKRTEQALER